ncbi:hypothetical protein D9M71_500770 [compost metagenome]
MIETGNHPQADLATHLDMQRARQRQAFVAAAARLAQRQDVARLQAPAAESANGAQAIGGAAAQHFGHIDAAFDGDVAARSGLDEVEAEHLPGTHAEGGVTGHFGAVHARSHGGAADGDQGVALELQLRTEQRAFEQRGGRRVAHQQVGGAQGVLVERPGRRDAQVVIAFAAGVLHRGGEAGLEHLNRHGAPPAGAACSLADR